MTDPEFIAQVFWGVIIFLGAVKATKDYMEEMWSRKEGPSDAKGDHPNSNTTVRREGQ